MKKLNSIFIMMLIALVVIPVMQYAFPEMALILFLNSISLLFAAIVKLTIFIHELMHEEEEQQSVQ